MNKPFAPFDLNSTDSSKIIRCCARLIRVKKSQSRCVRRITFHESISPRPGKGDWNVKECSAGSNASKWLWLLAPDQQLLSNKLVEKDIGGCEIGIVRFCKESHIVWILMGHHWCENYDWRWIQTEDQILRPLKGYSNDWTEWWPTNTIHTAKPSNSMVKRGAPPRISFHPNSIKNE